jgi:hypothetical protein
VIKVLTQRKELQEVRESNRVPVDLKEDFRGKITVYLRISKTLDGVERRIREKGIFEYISGKCVQNGVAPQRTMGRLNTCVNSKGGLEKVINFDADEILRIRNMGKVCGAILYEILDYCKNKVGAVEARPKAEISVEELRDFREKGLRAFKLAITECSGGTIAPPAVAKVESVRKNYGLTKDDVHGIVLNALRAAFFEAVYSSSLGAMHDLKRNLVPLYNLKQEEMDGILDGLKRGNAANLQTNQAPNDGAYLDKDYTNSDPDIATLAAITLIFGSDMQILKTTLEIAEYAQTLKGILRS